MSARSELWNERGQASVELVALLPLLLVVGVATAQLLAAAAACEQAGTAAQAGAMALVQGGSPEDAAREAVRDVPRSRLAIRVDGRRIRVRVRPAALLPGLASALTATALADAGPPAGDASPAVRPEDDGGGGRP